MEMARAVHKAKEKDKEEEVVEENGIIKVMSI